MVISHVDIDAVKARNPQIRDSSIRNGNLQPVRRYPIQAYELRWLPLSLRYQHGLGFIRACPSQIDSIVRVTRAKAASASVAVCDGEPLPIR